MQIHFYNNLETNPLRQLIAGEGFGLSSCGTEWLDINNKTQDPIEEYYQKESNIQQAIVAAYDPLHWFDYANNYCGINIYPEVIADQCFPGGGDVNDMNQYFQ